MNLPVANPVVDRPRLIAVDVKDGCECARVDACEVAREDASAPRDGMLHEMQRLQPRLLYSVFRRLSNRAAAEDVVQQTMIKAWRNRHRFDATRPLAPWLLTIALRLAEDYARRDRRHHPHHSHRGHDALPDSVADHQQQPDQQLMQQEREEAVWAIARRVLPARESAALWLQYGENMTPTEIAEAMKLKASHVRVMLHRARLTLQPHLAHMLHDEDKDDAVEVMP